MAARGEWGRGVERWRRGTIRTAGSSVRASWPCLPSRRVNSLAEIADGQLPRRRAYQTVPEPHASAEQNEGDAVAVAALATARPPDPPRTPAWAIDATSPGGSEGRRRAPPSVTQPSEGPTAASSTSDAVGSQCRRHAAGGSPTTRTCASAARAARAQHRVSRAFLADRSAGVACRTTWIWDSPTPAGEKS
jgi:hypothetical protein